MAGNPGGVTIASELNVGRERELAED
jgi:hypothetical protein